jgi:hypothetical protein
MSLRFKWVPWINDLSDGIRTMRLGTWNVRSLYRAGSLVTVSKVKVKLSP